MRHGMSLILCVLLGCLVLVSCGKDHGSPTGPDDGTYVLKGMIFMVMRPLTNEPIHITGNGVDRTVLSDDKGVFTVFGLEAGTYTVRAENKNYYFYPDSLEVTVPGSEGRDLEFASVPFDFKENFSTFHDVVVCGRITTEDGNPVANTRIGYAEIRNTTTNQQGYYTFIVPIEPDSTLTVIPSRKGYAYRFSPDSLIVGSDQPVVIADFTASYSGPPLHSISGKWVNHSIVKIPRLSFSAKQGSETIYAMSDSLGRFRFDGLIDGTYIITGPDFFSWQPEQVIVELKGSDARTPDFVTPSFIGQNNFVIRMRVVDRDGNGIPDVSFNYRNTDRNGSILISESIKKSESKKTVTFTPRKDWYTFTPASAKVTLEWKEKWAAPDTVTIPDFIGTGYPVLSVADYFPVRTGASWTYEQTRTGEPSREYTVGISGKISTGGIDYFHTGDPGAAGFSDFRIEGNSVRTSWQGKDAEFLRFGVNPETTWEIGRTSGNYLLNGKFLGMEAVTVPAGTWPDCAKFEVRTTYGETSYYSYTLWFAKGVGMVRSEYVLVNYGETKEAVTLALKSHS